MSVLGLGRVVLMVHTRVVDFEVGIRDQEVGSAKPSQKVGMGHYCPCWVLLEEADGDYSGDWR